MNAPGRLVIEGCAIATVDPAGTEHASGYLVVEGDRILTVGAGSCPDHLGPAELVDGAGCLATPGSVTGELMRQAAELARRRGVRLHTHLAETLDEEAFCRERFGRGPVEYLDDLGWLGEDVWLAHCVHLDEDAVRRLGATGMGVAHCPSSNARLGAGIAPIAGKLAAEVAP